MAEGAKLTTAFAKRGLIAEHGSAWMLPRLIGPMNALDLLYSAGLVDTAEAERLGLVRQLPADNFRAQVQAIARELVTASSPGSIGVNKRQVFQSYFQSRRSLGGRRQGDDRIVWLGRFQGRGGAFRREAHRDVFRSMTRASVTRRSRRCKIASATALLDELASQCLSAP